MKEIEAVIFADRCKKIIMEYERKNEKEISPADISLEWEVSGEQGDKALLRVHGEETTYYEVTRSEDTEKLIVEAFRKCDEFTVKGE